MFKSKILKTMLLVILSLVILLVENLILISFYKMNKNQKVFQDRLRNNQGLMAKCNLVQASSSIITIFRTMHDYVPSSMIFPDDTLHVNYGRELPLNSSSWTDYAGVGIEFIFDNNGILVEKICR